MAHFSVIFIFTRSQSNNTFKWQISWKICRCYPCFQLSLPRHKLINKGTAFWRSELSWDHLAIQARLSLTFIFGNVIKSFLVACVTTECLFCTTTQGRTLFLIQDRSMLPLKHEKILSISVHWEHLSPIDHSVQKSWEFKTPWQIVSFQLTH